MGSTRSFPRSTYLIANSEGLAYEGFNPVDWRPVSKSEFEYERRVISVFWGLRMITVNPVKRFTSLQIAYIRWLKTLGTPTHAVTLTFKLYRNETKQIWSISIIKNSLKVFMSILSRNVFGKHAKKNNQCVMSAVVIGTGSSSDHPHAHITGYTTGSIDIEPCKC